MYHLLLHNWKLWVSRSKVVFFLFDSRSKADYS